MAALTFAAAGLKYWHLDLDTTAAAIGFAPQR